MIGSSVLQRVRVGLASSGPPALNAASLQAALQAAHRTPGGPNGPVLDPRTPLEDVRKWKAGFQAQRGQGAPLMLRRWLLDPAWANGMAKHVVLGGHDNSFDEALSVLGFAVLDVEPFTNVRAECTLRSLYVGMTAKALLYERYAEACDVGCGAAVMIACAVV